jgi:hypothetical protein
MACDELRGGAPVVRFFGAFGVLLIWGLLNLSLPDIGIGEVFQ